MSGNEIIDVNSIQDERSGEIIPMPGPQTIAKTDSSIVSFEIVDYDKVGTLEISEKSASVLAEPLDDKDIRIRPDGNIYVPWTWYAERLNKAFGVAQWGLIPQGMPLSKPMGSSVLVVWGHWLIIHGIPIGFAMGETSYYPSNNMMSYADACEGAKSNSLARNCKLLGMTLDLWDNEFGNEWKQKYAVKTTDNGKVKWVKKPSTSAPASTPAPTPVAKPASEPSPEPGVPAEPKPTPEPVASLPNLPQGSEYSIPRVKQAWITAAVKKGILKDVKDSSGANLLIRILGDAYISLNNSNVEENLAKGLSSIENWKPG